MPTDGSVLLSGFCVLFCFKIEKVEMEGTCSMYGEEEKCIQGIGGEI
jgi:hypothetical protein